MYISHAYTSTNPRAVETGTNIFGCAQNRGAYSVLHWQQIFEFDPADPRRSDPLPISVVLVPFARAHEVNRGEMMMMSFICSCRNQKEEPSSIYTLRKVRTIRGCLEGLTLMI